MTRAGRVGLVLGPVLAVAVGLALAASLPAKAAWCGAVTALVAVWWVTEPIPIPATTTAVASLTALPATVASASVLAVVAARRRCRAILERRHRHRAAREAIHALAPHRNREG